MPAILPVIRPLALSLAGLALALPAAAQDLEFTLVNDSEFTLVEFLTAPRASDAWSSLGIEEIESGYAGNVVFADGTAVCEYDMRLVFDSGDVLEDAVNVCEMGSYTVN